MITETEQKEVLFFRKEKNHYYKYGENIFKVDKWSINLLKNALTLPYNVKFIGYSRVKIGRILLNLYENGMKVQINKADDILHNHKGVVISFSEQKQISGSPQASWKVDKEEMDQQSFELYSILMLIEEYEKERDEKKKKMLKIQIQTALNKYRSFEELTPSRHI